MVVRVSGDVDLSSAPRLRSALLEVSGRGHRHLELDLQLVDFIDSSGIGVLLGAVRRARYADGSLRIVACGDELRRLLALLDLEVAFGLDAARAAGSAASTSAVAPVAADGDGAGRP